MKNYKTLKIIAIICIILSLFFVGTTKALAITQTINPNDFEPGQLEVPTDVTDLAGTVIAVLQVLGVVISAIVIGIIGIKYLIGSAEQKADYKKTMIPYLVGVIMLVCTTTFIRIIYSLIQQATA